VNAVALLAALAGSTASWSAPQTVSAPHTFAGPLFGSNDSRGGALVAWGWQDDIGQAAPTGAGAVTVDRAGSVSPERRAPAGLVAAQGYGAGRSLLLANRQIDKTGQRWRLTVTDGATTTRLATAFILFRPQLSVAPDGSAIVAWVEFHNHRQIVRVATRNHRGHFSRPTTLSGRGQTTVLTAAAAGARSFLVAFARNGRLLARTHSARGWSRIHPLQRAQGKTHWQLFASRDGQGGLELVWIRHRFTTPGRPGVRELFAAGHARRWSSIQRLERDGAVGPSLTFAPVLTLTYAEGPNSGAAARLRYLAGPGRFGAPLDAAPPQGGLRSVSAASAPGQGTVVGWVIPTPSGDGGGIGYAAATNPSGADFGPREQVTPNEAAFDMRLVRTASGVRAFWTARPEGTGPSVPVDQVHTVVRTALRLPQGS
jgi:hypothetical protein